MNHIIADPKTRKYVYAVIAALIPVAVAVGLITEEQAVTVGSSVLGLAAAPRRDLAHVVCRGLGVPLLVGWPMTSTTTLTSVISLWNGQRRVKTLDNSGVRVHNKRRHAESAYAYRRFQRPSAAVARTQSSGGKEVVS